MLVAICASSWVPPSLPLSAGGYQQIASKEGVSVYKRPGADVIQLAAEGRFDAPPEQVFAMLLDYDRQVRVLDRLSESQVLTRGRDSLLVYQRLNLPVISDRDYILYVHWRKEGDQIWIEYRAVRGPGPRPRPGVVRVTDHSGIWRLWPLNRGRSTGVRLETRIDMAGWLPRWMARSSAGDELPDMFAGLRQLLVSH